MTRAWISAGSNIEPAMHIQATVRHLQEHFGELKLSPLYRTPAEGFDGDDFLNMVIGIETDLSRQQVRQRLREIEDQEGRERGAEKFSSRTLDLDLLTWGHIVDAKENLPRDEILRYAFVLKPLSDVAPDERHPQLKRSYADLWEAFDGDKQSMQPVDW